MFPKLLAGGGNNTSLTGTRGCHSSGCSHTTREGKPYCPDHVGQHPYVQEILSALEERRAEDDKVRARGARAVNLKGLTAKEILLHLTLHGSRTIERLSRELQIDNEVLLGYVRALVKRGVIDLGRTNRGSTVVKLVGQEE